MFLHRCWLVAALSVFLSTGAAEAQESINYASISGRVTDPQGAVVAGAVVAARQIETAVTAETTTDDSGRYRFPYLRVGSYELSVAQAGFAPATRRLALTLGSAFDIPIVISVEGVTTSVTVSADAPILESARSQVAITVPRQEVNNLPLNGRNFLDIAVLAPAVAPPNINSTQLFAETSAVQGVGLSVGSQRNLSNSFIVDGLSANDDAAGLSGLPVRGGCGRAVPGGHLRRAGRTRAGARWLRQRRDAQRHQRPARHRLRLLQRRRLQRGQRALGHDAADVAAAVRRQPGRSAGEGPHVLLRQRGAAPARPGRSQHHQRRQCRRS